MRAPGGNRYDLLVPRFRLEDSVLVTLVLGKAALPTWVFRGALALIWALLSLSVQVGCRAQTDPLSCDDHTDHSGWDAVGRAVECPGQTSSLTDLHPGGFLNPQPFSALSHCPPLMYRKLKAGLQPPGCAMW